MVHRKHNRVDGKGRIVIPVKIRQAMGIEPGSMIEFDYMARRHQLVIRAVTETDQRAHNRET
ncbi:AbrB/MazE/SpoVT family DNA-binding domain-containing protein [Schleiferilactobacillus shenzhenensis]|uniref:SpoVT-AbrB domain-containing protein n=1 Tax=Schleiferilactobacillus shenzhenensis LY-73 TaxID=1231336 RepID=U4TKP2_9LACO|nr:AbrB/MazE/SpoVT family DNA-binding domain-containing protein [Schleiferilactobacillus shenzhenensis]ERL65406.1 hypothetical protein L248_2805 [Schleiferilactobacillus shenzhenensis LY-73]